ncbi:hypothetical protein [Streptomyces sp. NPDC058657]|uniref:hypothetical protein n=1 Tax=unclassified Streptomyces TaxID=2593676 RepID=UPI003649A06F
MTTRYIDLNTVASMRTPRPSVLTTDQIRRGNAVHEAAHALVGLSYGMNLARIRLTEEAAVGGGLAVSGVTTWNRCRVDEVEFAVQCAAGAVAEQRLFDEAGLAARVDGAYDEDLAVVVLVRSGFRVVETGPVQQGVVAWDQVTEMAHRCVGNLWPQITRVAEALLAAPAAVLEADQVCVLTRS